MSASLHSITSLLPPRQEEVLVYVAGCIATHGSGPTHRLIAQKLSLKSADISPYLLPLVRKGYLVEVGKTRTGAHRKNYHPTQLAYAYFKVIGYEPALQLDLALGPIELTQSPFHTDTVPLQPVIDEQLDFTISGATA